MGPLILQIPLVQSTGPDDGQNLVYFVNHMNKVREEAIKALNETDSETGSK